MAYLKVLGGPIPPSGKAFSSTLPTTLMAEMLDVYSDSTQTYPTQHFAAYDSTNHRWKPLGGTDGAFWYLPGPNGAEPEAPITKFTEVQNYADATTQTFTFWRRVIGDGFGVWEYSSPDADVTVVSSSNGIPSGVASWANVKHPSFGATGDGTTDDLAAINLALASISSGGDLYFPPGEYYISNNLTLPANIQIHFDAKAKIKTATGKTLTLAGSIVAGSFQLFSGTGSVALAATSPQRAFDVRWWGATGDGTTNDYLAFQNAVNSFGTNKRTLDIPPGHYKIDHDLLIPTVVTVRPHPGAFFEPTAPFHAVSIYGPLDKGSWNIIGAVGSGLVSFYDPPPVAPMQYYTFDQSNGGVNWDADVDTRSGGTHATVVLPDKMLATATPMVFNSSLGFIRPAQYAIDQGANSITFVDGAKPIYDGTYAEEITVWTHIDWGN